MFSRASSSSKTSRPSSMSRRAHPEGVLPFRAQAGGDETIASFADRWLELRPRQKESTNIGYRDQVRPFVAAHGGLALREVDVELAYAWLTEKRWTLNGLRAMFTDARRMNLVESN